MPTGAAAAEAATRAAKKPDHRNIDKGPGSLAGNITRDLELRYTDSGRAVTNIGVACSERVRDKGTGEWKDGETAYFEVQCWGNLAENCAEYLRKGDRVVAEGRWTEMSYTDNEDVTRTKVVLTARDLGPSMMFRGARPLPKPGKDGHQ